MDKLRLGNAWLKFVYCYDVMLQNCLSITKL